MLEQSNPCIPQISSKNPQYTLAFSYSDWKLTLCKLVNEYFRDPKPKRCRTRRHARCTVASAIQAHWAYLWYRFLYPSHRSTTLIMELGRLQYVVRPLENQSSACQSSIPVPSLVSASLRQGLKAHEQASSGCQLRLSIFSNGVSTPRMRVRVWSMDRDGSLESSRMSLRAPAYSGTSSATESMTFFLTPTMTGSKCQSVLGAEHTRLGQQILIYQEATRVINSIFTKGWMNSWWSSKRNEFSLSDPVDPCWVFKEGCKHALGTTLSLPKYFRLNGPRPWCFEAPGHCMGMKKD